MKDREGVAKEEMDLRLATLRQPSMQLALTAEQ